MMSWLANIKRRALKPAVLVQHHPGVPGQGLEQPLPGLEGYFLAFFVFLAFFAFFAFFAFLAIVSSQGLMD